MGVQYSAIAMFGIYLDNEEAVREFLLKEANVEEVEELESNVQNVCLDLYTSEGFIIGYKMTLGETVDKYQQRWDKQFPHCIEKPEAIMEVRVS